MTSPEILSEEMEFTWKIENFSMYPHEPGEAIHSPLLSVGNPRHSIFYLKMYPRGWDEDSRHMVAADLIRMEGSFKGQLVCTISLVAGDGSTLEGQISTNCRSIIWNRNTGAIHFDRRLRINEDFTEHFLSNDTLIVRCKIVIRSIPRHFSADLIALSETINSLYESKAYSDLTLCSGDKKFQVHKFILKHRAPGFFKDLGLQINNSKHECIKINGISTPVLQSLIQYMYNGKLEDLPSANVPEILEIAIRYGINRQNFLELTDEVINLGSPSTISMDIQVLSKKINWIILPETVQMRETDYLDQCICFGPIRFLLKLNFCKEGSYISFKCLSKLEKDIFLGCKLDEQHTDVQNWDSIEYRKLRFSVDHKETELQLPGERLLIYHGLCSQRLQLLISISDGEIISAIDSLMFVSPELPSQYSLSFLRNDMISLFNKTQLDDSGDITLVAENTRIVAHKAILAARSSVFVGMFSCDMVNKDDEVTILDVDCDTALRLVRFIYCGTVIKQSFKEDTKLYMAAHQYQVSSLFRKCSSFLESHLVLSNVCDILALAYVHNDNLLLDYARKVFYSNREAVQISRDWIILSHSDPHFSSMMQQPI